MECDKVPTTTIYSASEIVSSPTRLAYLQAKPLTAKQKERIWNGIFQVTRVRGAEMIPNDCQKGVIFIITNIFFGSQRSRM
jgi:hypothetical protein